MNTAKYSSQENIFGQAYTSLEHHREQSFLQQRVQCILQLSDSYYWEQDSNHCFTFIQYGCDRKNNIQSLAKGIGKTHWEIGNTPIANNGSWQEYNSRWKSRESFENFEVCSFQKGNESFFSISGQPFYDEHGLFQGYRGITTNINEEKLQNRYSKTIELLDIGISHVDPNGQFIEVNQKMSDMLGYSRSELLKLNIYQLSHADDETQQNRIKLKLESGEINTLNVEQRCLRKDRTEIWVKLTLSVTRTLDGNIVNGVSMVEDISVRKQAEERVQYLATHDEMTGLPNRTLFSQLLNQSIKSSQRYQTNFAILSIDLDHFKKINDSLGHDAGDILLTEISKRLRECLRASDIIARFGGDKFMVLLPETQHRKPVKIVANTILTTILKPIKVSGQQCQLSASIGIALYPEMIKNDKTLMQNADTAMYLAKSEGRNNYQFYNDGMKSHSVKEIDFELYLRHAIENNEFDIHYQPRVNLKSGEVQGVEALLRWNNNHLGSVSPNEFIPIAEETGLIVPLGKWVIRKSCEQNNTWRIMGLPQMCISVNLSPRQFMDNDLIPFIKTVLEETNVPAELLELEITESMIMQDTAKAVDKLFAMKALGLRIAIDDFGTGYSSLAQLKRFPVDTIKIDRSFICDLPFEEEDKAITEAIIVMGKLLGLTVVAEGVETAAQQSFLSEHECDEMQGFYFSKPTSPEIFENLLRNYQPTILN